LFASVPVQTVFVIVAYLASNHILELTMKPSICRLNQQLTIEAFLIVDNSVTSSKTIKWELVVFECADAGKRSVETRRQTDASHQVLIAVNPPRT